MVLLLPWFSRHPWLRRIDRPAVEIRMEVSLTDAPGGGIVAHAHMTYLVGAKKPVYAPDRHLKRKRYVFVRHKLHVFCTKITKCLQISLLGWIIVPKEG